MDTESISLIEMTTFSLPLNQMNSSDCPFQFSKEVETLSNYRDFQVARYFIKTALCLRWTEYNHVYIYIV